MKTEHLESIMTLKVDPIICYVLVGILIQLHWLPVEAGIHYKIASFAVRHFGNIILSRPTFQNYFIFTNILKTLPSSEES